MKQLIHPILIVTSFVVVYNALPFLGASEMLITLFFLISPFPVLWLIIRILKKGTPSNHTWNEKFYDDHSYKRNGLEEI